MKKKNFYREDLPKLFNKKNLIGVELGVARGDFSRELIKSNKFKILFGIDSYSLNQHNLNEYKFALKNVGMLENYKLINMKFDDALDLFPDKSLDFIYFDGYAHTGQNYGKTINDWSKKIKVNGILSGDDYDDKWELNKKIIDQFALKNKLNLSFTNVNKKKHIYSSWYIRISKNIKKIDFKYSKLLKYKEIIKSVKLYAPNVKKV